MNSNDLELDPELAPYLTLDDRPGPAARLSRERALAMVETALAELPAPVAAPRSKPSLPARWLVAAGAVVGVMSGVAAAHWYFTQEHAPAPAAVSGNDAAPHARNTEPAAPVAPAPQPEVALEPVEVADDAPERAIPSERRGAVEDLLQKANRLRTQGRFRDAAETYGQVSDRYPKTLSSYVAQVAAASIELEHLSHPARARRLFERALREHPEGALDLEARQGLATALRDLGEDQAERDALRRLIDVHPGSPAARRATARLHELDSN